MGPRSVQSCSNAAAPDGPLGALEHPRCARLLLLTPVHWHTPGPAAGHWHSVAWHHEKSYGASLPDLTFKFRVPQCLADWNPELGLSSRPYARRLSRAPSPESGQNLAILRAPRRRPHRSGGCAGRSRFPEARRRRVVPAETSAEGPDTTRVTRVVIWISDTMQMSRCIRR